MHTLIEIECRFSGPIPKEERWTLRFGSRAAYERARARAALRYFGQEAARLVRSMAPSEMLHDKVRALLRAQAALPV